MVALFPALIVTAALIALLPDTAPIRAQLGGFFERMLPPAVMPILRGYFVSSPHASKSTHVLSISIFVSFTGASSVIATFMEGFRRANELPYDCWTFWRRRARAYALVPLSLLPLGIDALAGGACNALYSNRGLHCGFDRSLVGGTYRLGRSYYADLSHGNPDPAAVATGASWSDCCYDHVVSDNPFVWVVCNPVCQLFPGLRFSRSWNRPSLLVIYRLAQCSLRFRIQLFVSSSPTSLRLILNRFTPNRVSHS